MCSFQLHIFLKNLLLDVSGELHISRPKATKSKPPPLLEIKSNCDTEPSVTVIPMPSTLSLVTEETTSTASASEAAFSMQAAGPSMDNFEDEIVGKVIRSTPSSADVKPEIVQPQELPQPQDQIVLPTVPVAPERTSIKSDGPMKCEYCNNTYTDRHRLFTSNKRTITFSYITEKIHSLRSYLAGFYLVKPNKRNEESDIYFYRLFCLFRQ